MSSKFAFARQYLRNQSTSNNLSVSRADQQKIETTSTNKTQNIHEVDTYGNLKLIFFSFN